MIVSVHIAEGLSGTCESAREAARVSMQKAQGGIHPVEERRRLKEEKRRSGEREAARQRDTLAAVLDRYVREYGAKRPWRPATMREVTRAFEVDLKPLRSRLTTASFQRST